MFDPIGGFLRIRELYITYLETAFRIGDGGASQERRALLETPGALCTDPLVEPLPRYRTVDWKLCELPQLTDGPLDHFEPIAREAFVRLASSGLFDDAEVRLYRHQAEMLRRGTRTGEPGIVTSGTGSGKTESFLLPVLASITREALSWPRPGADYLRQFWWHDSDGKRFESFSSIPPTRRPLKKNPESDPFVAHRAGENRPAAMRCLILYPMNALVEDQLARLRKAQDSERARATMDDVFNGNRICFGRYTSDTPVTGFDVHPRASALDDYKRRARQLEKLFEEMVQFERTQEMVQRRIADPESGLNEDDRFLFPSVDGSELLSRWDMQAHPPDILITNVSMLGAMLNREVDAPIFDQTREWLTSREDAYFYLVLDELHLQRGAAGTEVAYLLRLLLDRLGLTDPNHRHKIRVLASSASLPIEGDEGVRSQTYLWDMFGSFGISATGTTGANDSTSWASAIVPGEAEPERPVSTRPLATETLVEFLWRHGGDDVEPACSTDVPLHEEDWRALATELGVSASGELADVVRGAVEESGRRLAVACWSDQDGRARATELSVLATRLFGRNDPDTREALRGLLLARGLGDAFSQWFPEKSRAQSLTAPSFRLHTFFRSIEGLYAPLDGGAGVPERFRSPSRKIGALSLERGTTAAAPDEPATESEPPLRLFEVLYCECCGEVLVGGIRRKRASNEYELLPNEADLDGLPDGAVSQRFEDVSYDQYCVFWPTDRSEQPRVADSSANPPESWAAARIDPATGVVRVLGPRGEVPASQLRGWLFVRATRQDHHGRTNQHRGTNVPYQCPACETDYSPRRAENSPRLSPIRHFRTGFAKTTQLLGSEMFYLLKLHTRQPKLVSFSDSRQDAAKAALDVESRHHEDVRRDVLISEIRRAQQSAPTASQLDATLSDLREQRRRAEDADEVDEERRLTRQIERVRQTRAQVAEGSVRIGDILEDPRQPTFVGPREAREPLKPLIRAFVSLGIHPTHPAGTRLFRAEADGEPRWFDWHELFEKRDGTFDWRDGVQTQPWLNQARMTLVSQMQKLVNEILLSRTYFALEEAGLGYLCLPRSLFGSDEHAASTCSAFVRVFGDAYRLLDSPYNRTPDPWADETAVGNTNRVLRFATALWGPDARSNLRGILERFASAGHRDGLLSTAALRVRLSSPDDDFWRCQKCARTHLHRGAEICTRCFTPLPTAPTGKVRDILDANFLAKRIVRAGADAFRLHCEELTGQTEDGADRQRKFRGILFPQFRPKRDADGKKVRDENGDEVLVPTDPYFLPEREEIDLLAVTTTMEVGIDIGPLQAILQANMPPQRFNYQQRVGRAGRRKQAYSVVLTVCRTKSHDLYYFREPRKITGDVPPPPFLTKGMPNIARRFLWKWWLNAAFARLRSSQPGPWPADSMRPPDIHGEFMPTDTYFFDGWHDRLESALQTEESSARRFLDLLCEDSALEVDEVWNGVAEVLEGIQRLSLRRESKRFGLAHSLAEQGNLPMYGMPTRVRDLYVGHRESVTRENEWTTIDRDLDLAVFEFAPGSVIVKDKREHVCIGFTGPLGSFIFKQPPGMHVTPLATAFGDPFWMLECPNCGSWFRLDERPTEDLGDCPSCGHPREPRRSVESREPLGFRTNFRPSTDADSEGPSGRHRSIQSEGGAIDLQPCPGTNLSLRVREQIKTYRLNRGGADTNSPGTWLGFSATKGEERLSRRHREAFLDDQMIADEFLGGAADGPGDFVPYTGDQLSRVNRIWLAAPKTTDALYIAPTMVPTGLSVERVVGARALDGLDGNQVLEALSATAVRAAALSATFVLVNRAALELDVDPEEFDVIEPRLFRPTGGTAVPVLQFADHLVNGAGFCAALGQTDPGTGTPLIASLLRSTIFDESEYPLNEFTRNDHERTCEQSCYRCLLRYRNQPYHGLLDWRLGLSFLQVLDDAAYRCGLDGDFTRHALRTWPEVVRRDVRRLERQFAGLQTRPLGRLWGIKFDGATRWAIVGHPLWDPTAIEGVLLAAAEALAGQPFVVVDSFNLARRPVTIRRAVMEGN